MKLTPSTFWTWFRGFAARLPDGEPPEELLDELLVGQLHAFDNRIFFEISTNTAVKELILTAQGDVNVDTRWCHPGRK